MNNNIKTRAALAGSLLAVAFLGGVKRPVLADNANANPDETALQSRIDNLQKQVEDLSAQLQQLNKQQDDLQKKSDAAAKAPPAAVAKTKVPITISGLVQLQGLARLNESGPAADGVSTFRLRRGQIGLQAQITPKISGIATFDLAKAQDSNDRPSDEVLQDLYISYQFTQSKDKKKANYIEVGQQKVPIGYESLLSSGALPLVEAALMYQLRDPIRGNYGNGRDTGIQLRGTQGKFDYRLGVFNGFGERQNALAISDAKAIIGRLAYNVTPGWQIGVSYGRGNTGVNASTRADRNLWNAFTHFQKGKLSLQGEYTEGNYVDSTNGTQDIRSYYGNVGYFFTPKLEGVARADFFDYKNLNATVKQYTLGLNYYLKGNNAKFQLNLVRNDGDTAAADSKFRNDWTELRSGFQVAF